MTYHANPGQPTPQPIGDTVHETFEFIRRPFTVTSRSRDCEFDVVVDGSTYPVSLDGETVFVLDSGFLHPTRPYNNGDPHESDVHQAATVNRPPSFPRTVAGAHVHGTDWRSGS